MLRASDTGGASNNRLDTSALVAGVSYAAIASFSDAKDFMRIIMIGSDASFENVTKADATDAAINSSDSSTNLGGRAGGFDVMNGRCYLTCLWDKEFNKQQMLQWAFDPFGMLRMNDEYEVWRTIAAGGIAPVALYHQRHHNLAA